MIQNTIFKILAEAEKKFKHQSIDSPRLTAEMLLSHVIKLKPSELCLYYNKFLLQDEISTFNYLVHRRLQHEPTAYILGERGFFESDFIVTPDVLIPRPETEILVEEALTLLQSRGHSSDGMNVLELGTGSGAIVISLAGECPWHRYFACDISLSALKIAIKNAEKIAPGQICFFAGNWFLALKSYPLFDLIISNPPYIPTETISTLAPEIYHYEPIIALDGGEDGLVPYQIIFDKAHHYLVPGGTLLLETGFDQKQSIENILKLYSSEYKNIKFIKDMAGQQRIVKIER